MMVAMQIIFLLLHGPDGHEVRINPDSIVVMHSKRDGKADASLFVPGANCLVNLTNGKSTAVAEECEYIHKEIEHQT
jgi:hypothetical protein